MSKSTTATRSHTGVQNTNIFGLLSYLLIVLAIWALYPKGYSFSDPVGYLMRANDLPNFLNWEFTHPFDHRLALLLIHWLSFEVFGVSTLSAYFPQITLFCILLFSVQRRLEDNRSQVYAFCVLLLLLPQTVTVFPDLGAATFMLLAVLILERRDSAWRGAMFAFYAVIAFLFKETAIFLIAPLTWIAIIDFRMRNHLKSYTVHFYISIVIVSAALISIYLLSYFFVVDDPMARFNTVEDYGARHLWSISSLTDLVDRIFIAPHSFLLGYAGASIILALMGCVLTIDGRSGNQLMTTYFVSGLLLFNFFSASLGSYTPLPLMDRMLAFLIPPLAILAADALPRLAERIASDHTIRTVTQTLFIALAFHWSVTTIARDFYAGYLGERADLHKAREIFSLAVMENHSAQLFVAEDRTPSMLTVYVGFLEIDQSRIQVCPSTREIEVANEGFILVDIARASFLARVYGSQTCAPELIAAARANGFTTLVDNRTLFFAKRDAR